MEIKEIKDIKAIKMRSSFYEKVKYEIGKINSESVVGPIGKLSGIPIIIDDKLDKDYEIIKEGGRK